ncbi:MAG: hypothetical protein WBK77_00015 [Alphaproteobacteria bacterium]
MLYSVHFNNCTDIDLAFNVVNTATRGVSSATAKKMDGNGVRIGPFDSKLEPEDIEKKLQAAVTESNKISWTDVKLQGLVCGL